LQREEVFEKLEELKRQGKLRHYGVSCLAVGDAALCLKQPGVQVLQLQASLLKPEAIWQALPATSIGDVGVVARQIFGDGLLLHSSSGLRRGDYDSDDEFEADQLRLKTFEELAANCGRKLPQLALQFLLQLEGFSSVLLGTTNVQHLEEHLAALSQPRLSSETLAHTRSLLQRVDKQPPG